MSNFPTPFCEQQHKELGEINRNIGEFLASIGKVTADSRTIEQRLTEHGKRIEAMTLMMEDLRRDLLGVKDAIIGNPLSGEPGLTHIVTEYKKDRDSRKVNISGIFHIVLNTIITITLVALAASMRIPVQTQIDSTSGHASLK